MYCIFKILCTFTKQSITKKHEIMDSNLIVMKSHLNNTMINELIEKDGIKKMYGVSITNKWKDNWVITFNDNVFEKDELIDELILWTMENAMSTEVYFFG